ncbi:uncharacterized protein LOC135386149 [Ornithodoros turicata]|uniref:uncharacterized protein LOC135386149 n=1 Tax=Ornithodoros turicata TaxID=34597 RepID=UPI00313A3FA7
MADGRSMSDKRLSLSDILRFVNLSEDSRSLVEGERLLDAEHVILCGKTEESTSGVEIVALCLSTSALKGDPHVVTASLKAQNDSFRVSKTSCTCKAGNSESCKHEVGVLLLCNRKGVANLDIISCTDTECWWKARGGKRPYDEVFPLENYCHVKAVPAPFVSPADRSDEVKSAVIALCPHSVIAKHSLQLNNVQAGNHIPEILAHCKNSAVLQEVCASKNSPHEPKVMEFYQEHVIIDEMTAATFMSDTLHNKVLWLEQRKVRITGTTCYPLYTYKKEDWRKKVHTTLHATFTGNQNTQYGIAMEGKARELYRQQGNSETVLCGLVVPSSNPWLGFTPDGIVFQNGTPERLLEIKCPVKGKKDTANAVAAGCSFLTCVDGSYKLKERHTYYAQVQLGMAVLNVASCDFVVYSSFDNTICVVKVPFNRDFCLRMLLHLKAIYFKHIVPILCDTEANKQK